MAALSTKNTMIASGNSTGSQSPMPPLACWCLARSAGGGGFGGGDSGGGFGGGGGGDFGGGGASGNW